MPCYTGVIVAAKFTLAAAVLAGAVSMTAGLNASARDASSRVEVMVCPDASGSSMIVSEPKSDSIINEPKVVISGSVLYISQIDFFVDNVYNNTLALGNLDEAFSSPLTLSPGTHTLKIVATDSCSQTTHTEHVVITYEPAIQPSVGEEVETAVDGEVVNSIGIDSDIVPQSPLEAFVDTVIMPPLVSLGAALDIVTPNEEASSAQTANVVRSTVFILGSALVLSAIYVSMLGALPVKLAILGQPQSKLISITAVAGLAAMMLVFML